MDTALMPAAQNKYRCPCCNEALRVRSIRTNSVNTAMRKQRLVDYENENSNDRSSNTTNTAPNTPVPAQRGGM